MFVGLIVVCISLAIFMPALIAVGRRHHQLGAIIALNLFLGWTLVGRIAAFVWSLTWIPQAARQC